jgi:hypothetical protein
MNDLTIYIVSVCPPEVVFCHIQCSSSSALCRFAGNWDELTLLTVLRGHSWEAFCAGVIVDWFDLTLSTVLTGHIHKQKHLARAL